MPLRVSRAQLAVLSWLHPDPDRSRHWGGKLAGAPPMAAVQACIRRGWARRHGHRDMDLFAMTRAGREALALAEGRPASSGDAP